MTILVSGCTGFVGSRLVRKLALLNYQVRGMSRQDMNDSNVEYMQADAFDVDSLKRAMKGIDVAYYLLHSMEGSKREWNNFAEREKQQARNFLEAAEASNVRRIIYLGGLTDENETSLSPHMKSRKSVGEILASGSIPVTELRASIIIGAQGGSFNMLRYLVERLRVMICPSWVGSYAQPIAIDDVVEYLAGCLKKSETVGRIFEIGGPDIVTYEQLMRTYSAYLNRRLIILRIPFMSTRLSSLWVDLITPVKASLARPLIDSLVHDTVVSDDSINHIMPLQLKTITQSIDIVVKETDHLPPYESLPRNERTGFRLNQRILMISLFILGICGTTYYWLDDRPDVYGVPWLPVSIIWYGVIVFATLMVHNRTRLGYMIAGILSWVTLTFWLVDNFHTVFEEPIISAELNPEMVIRNFVGVLASMTAIGASHNLFHKILRYQYKGVPV